MFFENTTISYPVLLITSIKKGFEAFGRTINKTGKIARWLLDKHLYHDQIAILARKEFRKNKRIFLLFDDTLIKKIYSQLIEGSGRVYDTQSMRRIMAHKLLVAMLSDGKQTLPLTSTFLFSKELMPTPKETKLDWIQRVIQMVQMMFSDAQIIVTADGAFSSKKFLGWCSEKNVAVEVRMRSNCVVQYQGEKVAIRNIKSLQPRGRQMARTIAVTWYEIPLYITAQKRLDKHGNESVVYQASTSKAKPAEHVRIYRVRWNIERFFRTAKQYLGLQECSSRKLEAQESHVASVLLAYALVQIDRKKQKLPSPESAINTAERKKGVPLKHYIDRLNRFFDIAIA
ncbi:MAG: transposase [Silvanigrellaceae bacterium]|nr:transposase [Silvanigrellaceae bacterium]